MTNLHLCGKYVSLILLFFIIKTAPHTIILVECKSVVRVSLSAKEESVKESRIKNRNFWCHTHTCSVYIRKYPPARDRSGNDGGGEGVEGLVSDAFLYFSPRFSIVSALHATNTSLLSWITSVLFQSWLFFAYIRSVISSIPQVQGEFVPTNLSESH